MKAFIMIKNRKPIYVNRTIEEMDVPESREYSIHSFHKHNTPNQSAKVKAAFQMHMIQIRTDGQ